VIHLWEQLLLDGGRVLELLLDGAPLAHRVDRDEQRDPLRLLEHVLGMPSRSSTPIGWRS
jgi:hypothetical protein